MASSFRLESALPRMTDRACSFVAETSRQPFLLYFALTPPHAPRVVERAFNGTANGTARDDWLLQGDASVGRVLAAIERAGASQLTLVLASSDHGAVIISSRAYPSTACLASPSPSRPKPDLCDHHPQASTTVYA